LTTASKNNQVLALFGPTACGKTALLEQLFCGPDRLIAQDATIISADSIQVYRGLDIGSAKPDPALLLRLPHELIDIRNPDQNFSLGDFVELADAACQQAHEHGRLPIISGGTAYYIKAFIYGLPTAPPANPALRLELQAELAEQGAAVLRAELAKVDPASHARIAVADHYRLLRALEVWRSSGQPLSSFDLPTQPRERWQVSSIAIDRPREALYRRIDARVEQLFAAGLEAEIDALRSAGFDSSTPALKGIGYAEFFSGYSSDESPEYRQKAIKAAIALHSRRYAKRQLTFMRSLPNVHWFPADDAPRIAAFIRSVINVAAC